MKVSLLEQKESIDDDLLEQVAMALKVPLEANKNFDEQAAIVKAYGNSHIEEKHFSYLWAT